MNTETHTDPTIDPLEARRVARKAEKAALKARLRGRRVLHHGQPTGVPGGWNRAKRRANPQGYLQFLIQQAAKGQQKG